jgi:hypothetical protein
MNATKEKDERGDYYQGIQNWSFLKKVRKNKHLNRMIIWNRVCTRVNLTVIVWHSDVGFGDGLERFHTIYIRSWHGWAHSWEDFKCVVYTVSYGLIRSCTVVYTIKHGRYTRTFTLHFYPMRSIYLWSFLVYTSYCSAPTGAELFVFTIVFVHGPGFEQ